MITYKNKEVDILEVYEYVVVVQEVVSGDVHRLNWHDLDEYDKIDSIHKKSNVISIGWARKWLKRKQKNK